MGHIGPDGIFLLAQRKFNEESNLSAAGPDGPMKPSKLKAYAYAGIYAAHGIAKDPAHLAQLNLTRYAVVGCAGPDGIGHLAHLRC